MDNIQREIDSTFITGLLNEYIDMQKNIELTNEEKDGILKFIIYLMKGE